MDVAADGAFPADPYPGTAPSWSFVHDDATSHRLRPDPGACGGWRVAGSGPDGGVGIDAWLAARGAPPLAGRVPVLAYGSNRCPSKITWLRSTLGLDGPVVALRVAVRGVAAVWATGWRARDGARPATLAVVDDAQAPEQHALWLATPDQVRVLDRCEGRGERYDLAWLRAADVRGEDGVRLDPVLAYWPAADVRAPLLVPSGPGGPGRVVRCRDVAQDAARALAGAPAPVPPGAADVVVGDPDPRAWPDRVFVYGTLGPGASAWWRLARWAAPAPPARAVTRGRVLDTGRGYPALLRDVPGHVPGAGPSAETAARGTPAGGVAPGHVVPLADPVAAMPALDAYEGPDYRRERVVVYRSENGTAASGELCWAWVWDAEPGDWPVVAGSWSD